MRTKRDKIIALSLVIFCFSMNCSTVRPPGESGGIKLKSDQKRGVDIIIQKKDGQKVGGELIAFRQKSLLLLSSEGADVSVDIELIRHLTIVNKAKTGKGFGYGALITGGTMGLLALLVWRDEASESPVVASVLGFALIGGMVGTLFGVAAGRDDTILLSTKSDTEIQEILSQLRKKARVPDYN